MEDISNLNESLKISEGIFNWIVSKSDGLMMPSNKRQLLSICCHDVVIEHHLGISTLLEKKICGPAFAIARPMFETFVRGVWLKNCATDSELDDFRQDKFKKEFWELLRDIEQLEAFESKVLSNLKKTAWKHMCGYTHGGIQQISRRVFNKVITPDYKPEEIVEILKLSQAFALLSFIQIVGEADRNDLAREAIDLLYKYKLFMKKVSSA